MELAYVEKGLRKALEHAQFLATDEEDLRKIYANKIHARAAGKQIKEKGLERTIKELEQVDLGQGAKFGNAGEMIGYLIGTQAAVSGKKGVENVLDTIQTLNHLPPEITAQILSRFLAPHAIPPLSAVKTPDKLSPQRKILARIVIRTVGNSLPEIAKIMTKEAKISRDDLDAEKLRERLELVRQGRAAVSGAIQNLPENIDAARERLMEHLQRLQGKNVSVHQHYDRAIQAMKNGRANDAKMYLKMIEYGQRTHEEELQKRLERIAHGKIDTDDVLKRIASTSGRDTLLGLAQELDLGNVESTRHWEEFTEEELKTIERVLTERNAKIKHVENLHRLFKQNKIRGIVRKALVWSKRMGVEEKAVDELIWGLAKRDPRVMELVEQYRFKNNGIGDLLRKISNREKE